MATLIDRHRVQELVGKGAQLVEVLPTDFHPVPCNGSDHPGYVV